MARPVPNIVLLKRHDLSQQRTYGTSKIGIFTGRQINIFGEFRRVAVREHHSRTSFASVMAEIPRMGPRIEGDTWPSTRTRDTASAPRCASRRPSAKVAILTPSLP